MEQEGRRSECFKLKRPKPTRFQIVELRPGTVVPVATVYEEQHIRILYPHCLELEAEKVIFGPEQLRGVKGPP